MQICHILTCLLTAQKHHSVSFGCEYSTYIGMHRYAAWWEQAVLLYEADYVKANCFNFVIILCLDLKLSKRSWWHISIDKKNTFINTADGMNSVCRLLLSPSWSHWYHDKLDLKSLPSPVFISLALCLMSLGHIYSCLLYKCWVPSFVLWVFWAPLAWWWDGST